MPDFQLPPPNPYSTKLAKAIYEMTARRDADLVSLHRAGQSDLIDARQEQWEREVLNGCIEALAHAENIVEVWKKLRTGMQEIQRMERAAYPEEGK